MINFEKIKYCPPAFKKTCPCTIIPPLLYFFLITLTLMAIVIMMLMAKVMINNIYDNSKMLFQCK